MTALRKVELISGITTGVLALAVLCTVLRPPFVTDFLALLPFYLGPAALVSFGSYIHAIRRTTRGLVMLMIGGAILTVMIFIVTLFGSLFYFYGLWGLLSLAPPATAILTMVASLLARRSAANN
jgi:hypothetical protein